MNYRQWDMLKMEVEALFQEMVEDFERMLEGSRSVDYGEDREQQEFIEAVKQPVIPGEEGRQLI